MRVQDLPDLSHIDRFVSEGEGGVAGDDEEFPKSGELGDDVFGDPVAEIELLGVTAHVREGQHGNGGTVCAEGFRVRASDGLASPPIVEVTAKTLIGSSMFFTIWGPRSWKLTEGLANILLRSPDTQTPPGWASAWWRAALLTSPRDRRL